VTTRNAQSQAVASGEATSLDDGVLGAALVGSILGGLAGLAVLNSLAPIHLAFIGSVVGVGGTAAYGVWICLAVVMSLVFAATAPPAITACTAATTWLTARIVPLRKLVLPLILRSPLGTTAAGVGFLYGATMGVVVGLVAVPSLIPAATVPLTNPNIVAGYAVFGVVFGLGYGLTLEGTIPLPSFSFISPRVRGTVLAPLLASVVSSGVVYTQQPLYLRYLGAIAGNGTPTFGLGIWVALTTILGLLFALVAADHASRGNGTTGYGFVYGIVLAVFVGLLAVPAVASAMTPFDLGFGDVALSTLGAFVIYGIILGSTFGKVINQRPLRPAFMVGRSRAVAFSALLAAVVSGGILYTTSTVYLRLLGAIVGFGGSSSIGLGVWFGVTFLFAMAFAALGARRIERTDVPAQTGLKVGTVYGVLLLLVGALVMPSVIRSATPFGLPTPHTNGTVLVAYLLFGVALGAVYEGTRGAGLTPAFLHGRGVPVVGGVVVGAAASAGLIYGALPPNVYFTVLGSIIGMPSLTGGLIIWFVLSLVFALLFVPLAAGVLERRLGVVRSLSVGVVYGGVLTAAVGLVGIPALTSISLPHTNPPVAGYFVFGVVFSLVYTQLRKRTIVREELPTSTAIGTSGQRAIVFGSLFGGSVGGLIVHHMVGGSAMRFLGAIVGYGGSAPIGWAVWLAISLILGLTFAVAVGPRLSQYARSMDEFVENDADLDAVFGDFLDRAPVTTAAAVAGFVYGIVAAIAVGAIAVPLAVNTVTPFGLFVPTLQPWFLLAFVLYGLVMGVGYGVIKEF
jgi:hypothetical protein